MAKTENKSLKTAVRFCTCVHPGQDAIYGKQQRLFNPTVKDNLRCTVCAKVISA
jgi:hypothetical protein